MASCFRLNCPRCRKQLVQVQTDGLTLHYECAEHGALLMDPLVIVDQDEGSDVPAPTHRSDDGDRHVNAS